MRLILIACTVLVTLSACNNVPPLTTGEKANFVHELIQNYPTCDTYRQRLDAPAIAMPAIDAIYRDAATAGCIKRDV